VSSKKAIILLYPKLENDNSLGRIQKYCEEHKLSPAKIIKAENPYDFKALTRLHDTAREEDGVGSLIIDCRIINLPIFPVACAVFAAIIWTKSININFGPRDEDDCADELKETRAELSYKAVTMLNYYLVGLNKRELTAGAEHHCLLEIINGADERMLFKGVEDFFRKHKMPTDLCKNLIGTIKAGMILKQKPNYEDYVHYLAGSEKFLDNLQMDKIFAFLPREDKYYIINSIFSHLQIRPDGMDFTLKSSFLLR
jgi:hypothetical protein